LKWENQDKLIKESGRSKQSKKYKEDDVRVQRFFEKYDKDNDGFLTVQDFLQIYEDAKVRSHVVWNNLQAHDYGFDLQKVKKNTLKNMVTEELVVAQLRESYENWLSVSSFGFRCCTIQQLLSSIESARYFEVLSSLSLVISSKVDETVKIDNDNFFWDKLKNLERLQLSLRIEPDAEESNSDELDKRTEEDQDKWSEQDEENKDDNKDSENKDETEAKEDKEVKENQLEEGNTATSKIKSSGSSQLENNRGNKYSIFQHRIATFYHKITSSLPRLENLSHLVLLQPKISIIPKILASVSVMKNIKSFILSHFSIRSDQRFNPALYATHEEPSETSKLRSVAFQLDFDCELDELVYESITNFLKGLDGLKHLTLMTDDISNLRLFFQDEFYREANLYNKLETLHIEFEGQEKEASWIMCPLNTNKFQKIKQVKITVPLFEKTLMNDFIKSIAKKKSLESCDLKIRIFDEEHMWEEERRLVNKWAMQLFKKNNTSGINQENFKLEWIISRIIDVD